MLIPFFAFRIMVGCGLVMLLLAWVGSYLSFKERLEESRLLLWAIFLSFPLPFIAILTGWFTAEVGRQPWTVYGVLRTADSRHAVPDGARGERSRSLSFVASTHFIFAFGVFYIHRLLRVGPSGELARALPPRPFRIVRCRWSMSRPAIGCIVGEGE